MHQFRCVGNFDGLVHITYNVRLDIGITHLSKAVNNICIQTGLRKSKEVFQHMHGFPRVNLAYTKPTVNANGLCRRDRLRPIIDGQLDFVILIKLYEHSSLLVEMQPSNRKVWIITQRCQLLRISHLLNQMSLCQVVDEVREVLVVGGEGVIVVEPVVANVSQRGIGIRENMVARYRGKSIGEILEEEIVRLVFIYLMLELL
mmetsp:Transcript_10343/g.16342  ORF Transcript_10343/g.16342 Transcript_10343/m.16342 type:complete len:202 (+) Transcript_10343:987-1592(+)